VAKTIARVTTVKKTQRNLPPGPGPGRPKGCKNKRTRDIAEAIMKAFETPRRGKGVAVKGGVNWLIDLKANHPEAFATLLGKLLPRDVNISGQITHDLADAALERLSSLTPEQRSNFIAERLAHGRVNSGN